MQIFRCPWLWRDAEVAVLVGVEAPGDAIIQSHQEVVEPEGKAKVEPTPL